MYMFSSYYNQFRLGHASSPPSILVTFFALKIENISKQNFIMFCHKYTHTFIHKKKT